MTPIRATPAPIPRIGTARDPETKTSSAPIIANGIPIATIPNALALILITYLLHCVDILSVFGDNYCGGTARITTMRAPSKPGVVESIARV